MDDDDGWRDASEFTRDEGPYKSSELPTAAEEGSDVDGDDDDLDEMFSGLQEEEAPDEVEESVNLAVEEVARPYLEDNLEEYVHRTYEQAPRPRTERAVSERNWKTAEGTTFQKMVKHLCFVARQALGDIEGEFEPSFAAMHLLYLMAAQVPLAALMSKAKSKSSEKEYHVLLQRVVSIAFRCSSAKFGGQIENCKIDYLFNVKDFDFGSEETSKVLSALRHSDPKVKMAAMRYAGEKILEVLRKRLEPDVETDQALSTVLSIARKDILKDRTHRLVKKALIKATTGRK